MAEIENTEDLFGEAEYQPFWMTIKNGDIEVGRGSRCDKDSAIMAGNTPFTNLIGQLDGNR